MVEKVDGYITRGGQMIVDEESAIIAETMEEIISVIPELRLIADKVQANLRPLCLHMKQLASYYGKNHPEVLEETTPEPPLPAKLDKEFWTSNADPLPRWDDVKERWDNLNPFGNLANALNISYEEMTADFEAVHYSASGRAKGVTTPIVTEKPHYIVRADAVLEPEDAICDCSALMNGDSNHSPSCITQVSKRTVADDAEVPPVDYI